MASKAVKHIEYSVYFEELFSGHEQSLHFKQGRV